MDFEKKLIILADSAKYDVSCSSSGSDRKNSNGLGMGSRPGVCHSFSADGRCISLLKILMTNICIYDCKYCINRRTNSIERALFTPEEIADITINFYRRNYIEGLFLSSGIIKNSDYTMLKIYEIVRLLREKYKFYGYIHVKGIPGANQEIIKKTGLLVDRMSVNIELPSNNSLKLLAPDKNKDTLIQSLAYVNNEAKKDKNFVHAGQTTQMIIGASDDSDYKVLSLSDAMYKKFELKRVYYSAYIPVNNDNLLPRLKEPPLVRENRLYQADWLLRFYEFKVDELFDKDNENFNYLIDPKSNWAIRNLNRFPMEINTTNYSDLIRIPGIGLTSALKIIKARKYKKLTFEDLKNMHISIKKAQYFITCNDKYIIPINMFDKRIIANSLVLENKKEIKDKGYTQLSLFKGSEVNE